MIRSVANNFGTIAPVLGAVVVGMAAYRLASLSAAAAAAIQTAGTVGATGATWSLNAALRANPIGLVITGITALAAGLIIAYKKSETFRKIVNKMWAALKVAGRWVADIAGKAVDFGAKIASVVMPKVIALAAFLVGGYVAGFKAAIGIVGSIIGKVIEFGGALVRGAQKAAEFLTGVKDKIGGALTFVAGIPGKILGVFGNAATVLYNAGVQLITGLANGIKTKIEDAVNAVKDGLGRIKGLLPGSPIKWGPLKNWNNGGAGKRLMSLVARGITDGSKITVKAAEGAFGKIEGALEASRDKLKSTLEGLKGDFAALASSVSGAFLGDLFGVTATDAVEASEGVAAVAGRTVGQNFVDNLLAKKGELTGLMASFKTLTGWGINPAFLSQLFASGNGALITELAGMGQAGAANAASLFGEVTSLGAQLGGAVAQNDPVASAIATTNVKLDEVNDQLRFLNDTIGPKLNRSAKEVATQAAKGVSNGGNKAARRGKRNGKRIP